jgi:MoaA/NifB/PqqE/SkfB family radical SAM enzyme
MIKNNFFTRRSLNIDITHRCALDCPRCQRWGDYRKYGKKVPGIDISISQMKKIISFYNDINFCGQYSDPVHHPKFIEIMKLTLENNITCSVHNASSAKPKDWYIKAFKSNPKARWVFGIDGLPKESHLYRINQDGEKLFDIMIESKKYLLSKPTWQYIIFKYNENHVGQAKQIAQDNDIPIIVVNSSRWWSNNDIYRPTKTELSFDPK